jgi:hypothetical protein
MSLAKRYAHVNASQPKEYWDYDNLNLTWGYFIYVDRN